MCGSDGDGGEAEAFSPAAWHDRCDGQSSFNLTYATEDGTIAKVQIAPSADTDHRAIRRIQRAMERSRRATNPDNYEAVDVVRHGKKKKSFKVKSGRLQWRFSKRYESLRAELAEIFRLSAATRKREHGEVCN